MSTTTKNRRHDDYRPASLRTFWNALYRMWWGFEDRMARIYDWTLLVLWVALGIAAVALAGFVLLFLWG
jgi:hypothetical protein